MIRFASLRLGRMVLAVLLCSTGIAIKANAQDLSGRWSGRWESYTSGHKGPLRGRFRQIDDSTYRVTFTGRFLMIIPFRYSVNLNVVEHGDVTRLEGSSYLGRFMGTFHYSAEATATEFRASYESCKDDGEWVLTRCCAPPGCDSK